MVGIFITFSSNGYRLTISYRRTCVF